MSIFGLTELCIGTIIVILILYFVPTFIAAIKGKSISVAIFALNLILGWTFIGWLVAFIWALTNDNKQQIVVNSHASNDRSISPIMTVPIQENAIETQKAPLSEITTNDFHQEKINQLKQLKELLDNGILTQEEFESQKNKILNS